MESKLIHGDSLEKLKELNDNSVDMIATDPPYAISFMGKEWDKALPNPEIFEECLRVLKPGGFTFVMSAPRSDVHSRMCILLEDAGFNIGFTPIAHCYATGFPKALNVGKKLDQYAGRQRTLLIEIKDKLAELYKASGKTKAQINKECGFNACGYLRKEIRTDDSWGIAIPTLEKWEVIKKVINCDDDLSKKLLKLFESAEREVIGKKSSGIGSGDTYAFTDNNDKSGGEVDITLPATELAQKFNGAYAGYQVKPAWESIIVCMKPIEKSGYVEQAKDNAGGITWLDDCRIPFAGMDDKEQFDKDNVAAMMNFDGEYEKGEGKMYEGGWKKPNREGLSRGNQPSRKPKSDYDKYVEKQESFKGAKTIGEINEGGRTFLGGDMKQLDPSKTYQKPKTTKRKPRAEDNDTSEASPMGRFPANLLVQDDILNTGKTTKSTGGRSYQNTNDMYSGGWSSDDMGTSDNPGKGDEGDFSRYFSLDEWWKRYFNKLPEEVQRTFPFLVIPKASKREKDMGLDKGKFFKVEYELDDGVPDVILKDIENHLKPK